MVLLLIHLRRLILLLSVVYLSGAVFRRLLTERHHAHVLQPNGLGGLMAGGGRWAKDPLHFQWWAYIYTCYAYVVLVNYVSMRRLTNLIEFFFT
ncbi:hypothetical protein AWZ03_000584 [Drosophila navojoa]|uniref:Uncharacterized protein n=3 Tax=mojavensis species complex TaxID=198037 RepID=B4KZF0_DROMO|nr:uncharacterized protein LOC6581679 [Drosophila mojavensis]XP_017862124.1 PREDICTED: uncharacterized protein LOC108613280 [Drosophila arizonae]XP_017862125.1 PREDICTED: uncharacterized protein LOC108613280 [Drosophila arizonae]XP_017862126.1 PREDICTED: uncharacterized protein LOC108613280 [Drosophila arizonae]XP_017957205.1 uncharacterized protein LOC108651820 [Drosophila navojoa]XP_017957206.1 uncharacterized protein LOC108651820 [Drosophila navojoa]XP_017957208.1 uncharacterized protein L